MINDYIARTRQAHAFLAPADLVTTIGGTNDILDPASTLISKSVVIGSGNVFYPNVIIEQQGEGNIHIGDGNTFYPGSYITSSAGKVTIGSKNEFGPAGVTIKANMSSAQITIGDQGRYCDGPSIMGKTALGSGSQLLGNITVQNCTLESGEAFYDPDPDKRAAVLKGFGVARDITVSTGQVVNGSGDFSRSPMQWQREYHPKRNKR